MEIKARHPVLPFAAAALPPVALIALGAMFGGALSWAALIYMTLFTFGMDQLIKGDAPPADASARLLAADALSASLAVLHFALLALVIWALSMGGLGIGAWITTFVAAALFFGQVSNSNAHELIHRPKRSLFELGKWVYISLFFGHHTSAHNKVHHRFAASAKDPNSAREGESFYHFAWRAWRGSFREGLAAERADLARRGTGGRTPYVTYTLGAAGFALASLIAFGWAGLAVHAGLAAYAQVQLLMSDYVQHYGLRRAIKPNGKLAAIGPEHSWNARHWFSRHLMLNAPRHSDHHAHPARAYPALEASADGPLLPSTLPVMAVVSLYPRGFKRMMAGPLSDWKGRFG